MLFHTILRNKSNWTKLYCYIFKRKLIICLNLINISIYYCGTNGLVGKVGDLWTEANKYWRVLCLSTWSYGSWIYNYLCTHCISTLKLWVRIQLRRGILHATLYDKVYQWIAAGRWMVLLAYTFWHWTCVNYLSLDITDLTVLLCYF
jgi:hypothetical protein